MYPQQAERKDDITDIDDADWPDEDNDISDDGSIEDDAEVTMSMFLLKCDVLVCVL